MTAHDITKDIVSSFKSKRFILWTLVRVISAGGPLLATYVFARGIDAIEVGKPVSDVIKVFVLLLLIWAVGNIVRIASKTRLAVNTEVVLIEIQEKLVVRIKEGISNRKEIVQAIRNMTQSIRRFSTHFRDSALVGIISFVSVPVILYFIDKKIFALELVLIGIYMLVTLVFSRIYERRYEGFNKSREYYYAEMQISNEVDDEAEYIRKRIKEVNDVAFFEWTTLQSIVTLFQFYILYLITKDIFAGTKHISDMVLIFGYTKETQVFLNAITGMIERLMEVRAGAERLVVVSNKEEPVSSIL